MEKYETNIKKNKGNIRNIKTYLVTRFRKEITKFYKKNEGF